MKKIVLLLFLMLAPNINAQNLYVEYDVEIDASGTNMYLMHHKMELHNSGDASVLKRYLRKNVPGKFEDSQGTTQFVKISSDTLVVYKDFVTKQLFSEEGLFTRVFNVEDSLNLFKWKIHDDTLTVLNKICQRATTSFRGRDYEAYFAEDIPVQDGPGKFNGLPGLILKVSLVNSDMVYSAEAVKIKIGDVNRKIEDPYGTKKTISFQKFKKEYNKKHDEFEAYNRLNDTGVTSQRDGIEILEND